MRLRPGSAADKGVHIVPSRFVVYCDSAIEAGWLLSVMVVPLFFNPHSSRIFEPDKLLVFRSIALVSAALWLAKGIEVLPGSVRSGRSTAGANASATPWEALKQAVRVPLVLPVVLFLATTLLSTSLSVLPAHSLWGSYERAQGFFTTLAYGTVFFSLLAALRQQEQLERLLQIVLITSIPVTLYGTAQHFGWDPLVWEKEIEGRVSGNMGNPIFLGAYLIMVVPVTLAEMLRRYMKFRSSPGSRVWNVAALLLLLILLGLQVSCILFTQSRGPWLGLLCGISFFILLGLIALRPAEPGEGAARIKEVFKAFVFALASIPVGVLPAYVFFALTHRGRRWLWISFVFHGLLAALFLLLLNMPASPLHSLRGYPYLGRLAQLSDVETGTGKVRMLVWQGTARLIAGNPGRMWFGHGPETMKFVWDPYAPPELAHYEYRNAAPDRAHNETLDAVVTTGLAGLAAQLLVVVLVFRYGIQWLGLMPGASHGRVFYGLVFLGMLGGTWVSLRLHGSFALLGLGIPAGMLLGVVVSVLVAGFGVRPREETPLPRERQVVLIALLSGLITHFVEIQTGVSVAATRLYFWVYCAVVVVLGTGRVVPEDSSPGVGGETKEPGARPPSAGKRGKRKKGKVPVRIEGESGAFSRLVGRRTVMAGFAALGFALFTLAFDCTLNPFLREETLESVWRSVTTVRLGSGVRTVYGMPAVFLGTWLLAGTLLWAIHRSESAQGREPRSRLSGVAAWGLSALFGVGGTGLFLLVMRPGSEAQSIVFYSWAVLGAGTVLGGILAAGKPWEQWISNSWKWVLYVAVGAVACWGGVVFNLRPVQADIHFRMARDLERQKKWEPAARHFGEALRLAPEQEHYHLMLGRFYFHRAGASRDREKDALYSRVEKAMSRAHELNPLNTDHLANLALLYWKWAESVSSDAQRQGKLEQAHHFYDLAVKNSPRRVVLYNNWARVYLYQGAIEKAHEKIEASLAVDDRFADTYLLQGEVFHREQKGREASAAYRKAVSLDPENAELWATLGQIYIRQGDERASLEANLKAVEINPGLVGPHSLLGLIYYRWGKFHEALEENYKVLELQPDNVATYRNLALIYERMGRPEDAAAQLEKIRKLSPESEHGKIRDSIDKMKARTGARGLEEDRGSP